MAWVLNTALAGAPAALLAASAAAVPRLPVYRCAKVDPSPVIDGRLNDPAWDCAPAVTLVMATSGEPAAKRTTARMCWDDDYLYICFDSADTDIWGSMTRRDDLIFREEVVEAFLSPDCSLTRYYEFNLSPRNVVFDALVVNPDGKGPAEGTAFDWNCKGVRSAVLVDGTLDDRTDIDRGWTAELAIPFAGLGRKTPTPGERWRVNLYRIDLDPKPVEFQAWSPTLVTPVAYHIPARFGTVFFTASNRG